MPDGSTWRHEYVITDHLGNTRLCFSDLDSNGTIDNTELLSTHDYYPFGLEWDVSGYKYTYNEKEKNAELGLDWLDYGARWLDPVTGRWNDTLFSWQEKRAGVMSFYFRLPPSEFLLGMAFGDPRGLRGRHAYACSLSLVQAFFVSELAKLRLS